MSNSKPISPRTSPSSSPSSSPRRSQEYQSPLADFLAIVYKGREEQAAAEKAEEEAVYARAAEVAASAAVARANRASAARISPRRDVRPAMAAKAPAAVAHVAKVKVRKAVAAENLHEAVLSGDIEVLRKTRSQNPNTINDRDPNGLTPLMLAAKLGNINAVEYLLKDVQLFSATQGIKALPAADATLTVGKEKYTALDLIVLKRPANLVNLVSALVQKGDDAQTQVSLFSAIKLGKPDVVAAFVAARVPVDTKSQHNGTAREYALEHGNASVKALFTRSEAAENFAAREAGRRAAADRARKDAIAAGARRV